MTYLGKTAEASQLAGCLKAVPRDDSSDGLTSYAEIVDGTSNTALLVEIAGKDMVWQKGTNTGNQLSAAYGGLGGWADTTSGNTSSLELTQWHFGARGMRCELQQRPWTLFISPRWSQRCLCRWFSSVH